MEDEKVGEPDRLENRKDAKPEGWRTRRLENQKVSEGWRAKRMVNQKVGEPEGW